MFLWIQPVVFRYYEITATEAKAKFKAEHVTSAAFISGCITKLVEFKETHCICIKIKYTTTLASLAEVFSFFFGDAKISDVPEDSAQEPS